MNKVIRNIIFSFLMIFSVVKPSAIESVNENEEFKAKLIKAISSNNLEKVKDIASTAEFSSFVALDSESLVLKEALTNLDKYKSKNLTKIVLGLSSAVAIKFFYDFVTYCTYDQKDKLSYIKELKKNSGWNSKFNDFCKNKSKPKSEIRKATRINNNVDYYIDKSTTYGAASISATSFAIALKTLITLYKNHKNYNIAKQIIKIFIDHSAFSLADLKSKSIET